MSIKYQIVGSDRFAEAAKFIVEKDNHSVVLVSWLNEQGASSESFGKIVDSSFTSKLITVNKFESKFGKSICGVFDLGDKLVDICLLAQGEKKFVNDDYLKLAGDTYSLISKKSEAYIFIDHCDVDRAGLIDIIGGIELSAYRFDKYITKKKSDEDKDIIINIVVADSVVSFDIEDVMKEAKAITDSVILARDLVNEPSNKLNTSEFKNRISELSNIGIEVEILDKKQLEELKMEALLGVAKGSDMPPYVAIMKWSGAKDKNARPLVFVGKGVVFDCGGLSIKPAAGMEDMKGDMGGSAAVVGIMQLLAMRNSAVNAVGIVGIVENAIGCEAQRPGDIVTSMSGQTIEVLNTDAEGRLVLADILHYAKENFSPAIMINLATLTGAILVALGQEHAGLFSNDKDLANKLIESGVKTGEKLWQLPLSEAYDKLIDSKNADMKNIGGRLGGSITAAQFLKRFVGDVSWAHLDIAGTAFGAPHNSYCKSWASGFGVRLLNALVRDHYENK